MRWAEHLFHTQPSLLLNAQEGTARHIWSEWVYVSLAEHARWSANGEPYQRPRAYVSVRFLDVLPVFVQDNQKAAVIARNVCTITNQTEGWCTIRFLGSENTFFLLSVPSSTKNFWLRQYAIVIYCDLVMCFILQILLIIWNHLRLCHCLSLL